MPRKIGEKELALRAAREARIEVGTNGHGQMSRAEAKDITRRINSAANDLNELLKEAHDRRAHAAMGYSTWKEYVAAEFKISKSRSYQLLNQSKVQKAIQRVAASTPVDISEPDARAIAPVLEDVTQEIVDRLKAGEPEHDVVAAVVRKRGAASTSVDTEAPDPVAEWERAEKELATARDTIESLGSDDLAKRYAALREGYARLEGRLQQEMQTRAQAEGTAKHWVDLLRQIAAEVNAKDFNDILPAIRDLKA